VKVLFIVLEDFPGGDTRVRRQVRALVDSGHQVEVLCAGAYSTEDTWSGCSITRTWTRRDKAGNMRRRLLEYLAFFVEASCRVFWRALHTRHDVVQVANMPDFLVFAAAPARWLRGSAVVLDLHDLMPELLGSKSSGQSPWQRSVLAQERASVRFANRVLTVNEMCARIVRARNREKAIMVIPNSPDESTFPVCAPKTRVAGQRVRIGYHGTVSRRFGVAGLIHAFSMLQAMGIDAELHVWGGGDDHQRVSDLVDSLKLRDRVTLHGQTPVQRMVQMLQTVDVAAVPYEADPYMAIAYSTKAFELAALGIPMVVSDLAGIREQFSDQSVQFFTAGNTRAMVAALAALIMDPQRSHNLACTAQVELQRYSWRHYAGEYVRALEQAAAS
jgi:glycosyltransferase involved in cell wall biosynthesis